MTILLLLALVAAILAAWGSVASRNPTDYFAAGRRGGVWLVGVAGTAAGVSAFTFVGGPGLFALVGAGSLWMILSAPLTGALQCWVAGEPIVRLARGGAILTVPELVAACAGRPAQAVAALVIVVGSVASLAVQTKAAAVLGEVFLGVEGTLAALVAMSATALYTALGGMRAGLVADAVQGGVMAVVAAGLAAWALAAAGGPAAALHTLSAHRPELLGSFGAVPPAQAFAWYALFCLGTLAQPHYLQKFLFLSDRSQLRWLPAVLTGALATTLTVWLGVGLAGSALVARGQLELTHPDDLAPRLVALLGPWAVALAGTAALAALMSTSASFLNLAAAAVTRDLPASLGWAPRGVAAARLATLLVVATATALGLASDRAVAMLGLLGWGFFTAALLPTVALGLAWDSVRPVAAATAMAAGAIVDLSLEAVRPALPRGLEPGLAGAAVGTLVLVGLSLLANRTARAVPRGRR
ncbi:MAG: hypothetical protein HXY19_04940 [Thermoanaerobaculaceae bacterium]|nr:hypothetical protein [Thermoanaerobaculaceae bacterium]